VTQNPDEPSQHILIFITPLAKYAALQVAKTLFGFSEYTTYTTGHIR